MNKIKSKVKNYLSDDSAVDRESSMIIGIAIAVAAAFALGYFAWNFIKGKSDDIKDISDRGNPGEGQEFEGSNPFGGGGD